VLLVATARADAPYVREARIAHLGRAMTALRALGADGRQALELALHTEVRTRCRVHPTIACMIEVARGVCNERPECLAASDVILTNQHAEAALVDESTRMRLVRTSSDYHAAVNAELWSRYALLAAELALAPPAADLATRIDRFCTDRDRTVHRCAPGAKACVPSLAWQRCASELAWYVASHDAKADR
jgi:hypothetical protein